MMTKTIRTDIGGHLEHQKRFFKHDLVESLDIPKYTARRAINELQVLDVVRIGKETRICGYNYYIELLEKFHWLLDEELQNLIKGL